MSFSSLPTLATAIVTALLLTGCAKQSSQDEHAGHDHGAGGHGEAKAHVETKDGIAMCTEHGVPEAQCAVCNPDRATALKPGESMQVRLPSARSAAIVGIQIAAPKTGAIADSVECVAELSFNQNKVAQIAAPVGGILHSVEADLGTKVSENQILARIWSAAIAEGVAKAVLSHQTLERERKLRSARVSSQAGLEEAEASHQAACQPLRLMGFSENQIEELGRKPHEQVLMEVRAPFAGEIHERMAVRGALVEAGKPLFSIVDSSTMWAILQLSEADSAKLKPGQPVELRLESLPEKAFLGRLTWIGLAVDERTRMVQARAEFDNPEGLLKDRMFARARVLIRESSSSLLVPSSAVQRIEGATFVFVKQGEDLFDARAVRLGARFNGAVEILAGLGPKEDIAVSHSFALKSAMLMSRLGAGCADD